MRRFVVTHDMACRTLLHCEPLIPSISSTFVRNQLDHFSKSRPPPLSTSCQQSIGLSLLRTALKTIQTLTPPFCVCHPRGTASQISCSSARAASRSVAWLSRVYINPKSMRTNSPQTIVTTINGQVFYILLGSR